VDVFTDIWNISRALRRIDVKLDLAIAEDRILEQWAKRLLEAGAVQRAEQTKLLKEILARLTPPEAVSFSWQFELEGEIFEGEPPHVRNDQKLTISITPLDKFQQPTKLDGQPDWTVDNATRASITAVPGPDANGKYSAILEPVGPTGDVVVAVQGDADLGEGVKQIFGTGTVPIEAGQAVSFKLEIGEPVDQAPPAV